MGIFPSATALRISCMQEKKAEILRLVEAQIAGGVDLSPEEMVDAAFIMMDKINQKLYQDDVTEGPAEIQIRQLR